MTLPFSLFRQKNKYIVGLLSKWTDDYSFLISGYSTKRLIPRLKNATHKSPQKKAKSVPLESSLTAKI